MTTKLEKNFNNRNLKKITVLRFGTNLALGWSRSQVLPPAHLRPFYPPDVIWT